MLCPVEPPSAPLLIFWVTHLQVPLMLQQEDEKCVLGNGITLTLRERAAKHSVLRRRRRRRRRTCLSLD